MYYIVRITERECVEKKHVLFDNNLCGLFVVVFFFFDEIGLITRITRMLHMRVKKKIEKETRNTTVCCKNILFISILSLHPRNNIDSTRDGRVYTRDERREIAVTIRPLWTLIEQWSVELRKMISF